MPKPQKVQDDQVLAKLDEILAQLKKGEATMSKEMDDLEAEVTDVKTVQQSAITLINGLAAQITAAGTDPVRLKAVTDSLKSNAADLAAAVAANTPAAPPTP